MEDLVSHAFWSGKRVLITGHSGFKGSWLTAWLGLLGAEVAGFSLPGHDGRNLLADVPGAFGCHVLQGDIRDFDAVANALERHRPQIVIHMAAQALVRQGYLDPLETFGVNIMGTANLLEAVRRQGGVRVVVNVTSDKCYENRQWPWGYRESDRLGGHDPYSASKACAELVSMAYRGLTRATSDAGPPAPALATVRAGNVIGGGDWSPDRLVPDVLRALAAHRPVSLRHPEAIRPWQHVLDPLRGYLLLSQRLWSEGEAFAGAWNFGPAENDMRPVAWVARSLGEMWGPGPEPVADTGPNPPEAAMLRLDSAKARQGLGWRPLLDLDKALQWTVAWHKAVHADPATAPAVTEKQLRAYIALEKA